MDNNNTVVIRGVSFVGLLQIVFIVLKLCGIINWSWICVLAPFWMEFVVLFFVMLAIVYLWKG